MSDRNEQLNGELNNPPEPEKIDLIKEKSDAVQEILSRTPVWMVRFGITLFFFLLVLILIASYFIKYPDVISGTAIVSAQEPPVPLLSKSTGKILSLFVKEKQRVNKGDVLLLIENPADYPAIKALKRELQCFSNLSNDSLPEDSVLSFFNKTASIYGDIQPVYAAFTQALIDYRSFLKIDVKKYKLEALTKQLCNYKSYYNGVEIQKHTVEQEYQLAQLKFRVDSSLAQSGTIAPLEFNALQSVYLDKKNSCQAMNTSLAQIKISIGELEKTRQEINMDYEQTKIKLQTQLTKSLESLNNQITIWEQTYLFIAPVDGVIALSNFRTKNQTVKAGEEVITVAPENTGALIARVKIAPYGSAKINVGQMVNVKLDNYPFEEYGILIGRVVSVSLVPNDASFLVEVNFPNGLKTSYGKQLDFNAQKLSSGIAEIVTRQRSLFERVFNKLEALVNRNIKN